MTSTARALKILLGALFAPKPIATHIQSLSLIARSPLNPYPSLVQRTTPCVDSRCVRADPVTRTTSARRIFTRISRLSQKARRLIAMLKVETLSITKISPLPIHIPPFPVTRMRRSKQFRRRSRRSRSRECSHTCSFGNKACSGQQRTRGNPTSETATFSPIAPVPGRARENLH